MCGPWNIMEQQKKTLHTVHMQPCQIAIPQLLHINSKMVEKNDHPHKTLAQPAWAISRRMYRSSSTLLASTQPITCMAHLLSCWTKTSSWGQVMHGKKKPKKNSTHQQQTTTSSSSSSTTTTTTTMHHQKRGHQKVNSWSAKQHWGLERIGKSSHVVEHHVGVYMRSRSPWGIRC